MADPWDPNASSANAAEMGLDGTSSGKVDIWGLPDDLAKSGITVDFGRKARVHAGYGSANAAEGGGGPGGGYGSANAAESDMAIPPYTSSFALLMANPLKLYQDDPQAYLHLQQAMYAAGFYGTTPVKSVHWGQYRDDTTAAWKNVLQATLQAQSAGYDLTPDDIIARNISGGEKSAKAAPKPPMVVDYTDPAQISGSLQSAAQSVLGRNLSDAEIKHFVSEFHAAELRSTKERYAASQDTTGKTIDVSTPPSLTQEALTGKVQEEHPTELAGNNLADYVGVIQQALGLG